MITWQSLSSSQQLQVLERPVIAGRQGLTSTVQDIIKQVRTQGDAALLALAEKFDGITLPQLKLTDQQKQKTLTLLSPEAKAAIDLAYNNIKQFHQAQVAQDISITTSEGVNCQLINRPIAAVGLYVPGGSAPLPSTVLMLGVPSQISGCKRVVLFTPADTRPENYGSITPEILYAAEICGVNEIYLSGGAQAIAAMAYGTESVKKVDKIFGPGNSFVTEAKQQVSLDPAGAAIDMPAGPSEVLVIADKNANPEFIAADLLSQAEHGPDSQVILVADDVNVINETAAAIERQLAVLTRADIARKALANSQLILTESLDQSIEISNRYAPEHLIVQTDNATELLPLLDNAASIFLGAYTPESAGDYASGTNHVLPTYGYSKVLSSLNLADFNRKFTVQTVTETGIKNIGPAIMTLANAEGLDAHRNAVKVRLDALTAGADNDN
ncbi:histidinol dehydrogenase [Psychrosphaera sp. B3R10]|uniref:histidinol dehydrogenase n=1 Tax=unclassified Psychrosphaera TaxID=2641570 RepID=UPI001C09AAB5|nr:MULTISPECIES: histidinol dehydrogenase [unclassified Psychrosphaera]MBU2883023.1 histidinol dehydrogenase [Psychrosphaera sp. I2R16]MBU2988103.1 histidinol dehydrogenase [Psychrosphaera sp. B3R10]